jgi:hypothetical protein
MWCLAFRNMAADSQCHAQAGARMTSCVSEEFKDLLQELVNEASIVQPQRLLNYLAEFLEAKLLQRSLGEMQPKQGQLLPSLYNYR